MRITEAEVLAALAESSRGNAPEDAVTVEEMADELRVSHTTIHRALKVFQRQGRLTVHHRRSYRLDGRPTLTPAYTISPAVKRKR